MNGSVSTTATYTYPAAGAAHPHAVSSVASTGTTTGTATYGYDPAGDTTTRPGQTLTYDPHGKLASVTTSAGTQSNVYDASGTLLLRTDQTGSTLYLGETELHVAAGSSQVSAVRTYTLAGKPVAERITQPGVSGSTVAWLGTDVDGTADVQVDATSGAITRRYVDPFGNTRGTITPWTSGHGFLNAPADASTGLTQLGARAYDTALGRFLTADPILAAFSPQQINGYSYSANNPITYTDPTGAICANADGAISISHNTCGGANHTTAPSAGGTARASSASGVSAAGNTGTKASGRSSGHSDYTQSLVQPTGMYHGSWDNYGDPYGRSNAGRATLGVVLIVLSVVLLAVPGAEEADLATVPAAAAEFGIDAGTGAEAATAAAEASEAGEAGAVGAESEEASTAGNLAKSACGGESFTPTTPVRLASGAAVAISSIAVGDQVLATDPATGVTEPKTVQKVWVNHDTDLLDVTITSHGATSVIHTTAQHPFWDDTQHAWTEAGNLRVGDRLRSTTPAIVAGDCCTDR